MAHKPLLDCVFVPIASVEDARATARAVTPYLRDRDATVVVGHVIEKAGGAPDKASVEQRERLAEEIFEVVDDEFANEDISHECHVRYGTDVADTIIDAADEFDADAIVFTPRGGSRWLRLLTGDVSLSLVTQSDRPVVVLPDVEEADTDG
ncbi:universal stress protein [Halobacterium bonnevillei]|uniref:Universal stress protein n=1 Tax=Halobacterium bonnevillei TaxID=2692200 RepID=A0A6B0SCV6_9EURY|nr:universal stress protein [Halobacterium bonnevillei]MXR19208.1 universal stress protein [Halobacterium bonnevillei]